MSMKLGSERREYIAGTIDDEYVPEDPAEFFSIWMDEALKKERFDATACSLATAIPGSEISCRTVLLKHHESHRYFFFGNRHSRKGRHLEQNPQAALLFYWPGLIRQIRIEGRVTHIEPEKAKRYFLSRPIEARAASAASAQSDIISSREELEERYRQKLSELRTDNDLVPEAWTGWVLTAERYEFWQGRENRLHDRVEYLPFESGWTHHRLQP